ncbi:putative (S)-2-haloacid dehalogenase 1 [Glarea lozoyensis 74030]|uniref:Putative (S)-2-haloacid dehalogenase 1 n=1 Tax=Glarea lozoyensis (strain ATCC 74030 / MF5533) TaxID=1104152 RepID=H0EXH6_GLAL7|nr:putative (S)-2-haloacid dehalogenase 1 [Glarea lozoyensis 74030]
MATPHHNNFSEPPKALTFDVFGTTVTDTLIEKSTAKLSSGSDIPSSTREVASKLSNEDWGTFAQQWRDTYKEFVHGFVPGESEWRDIDTHHHLALISLLKKWQIPDLYTDEEIKNLSLIWHFLEPWAETSSGLHKLGTKFTTSTLSNGNQSLLQDLNHHGDLGFRKLQSSADFAAYKPHPSVYRGAARVLGLEPKDVAMVAAHLVDLKAARECGFKTIYVERLGEEDWSADSEEYRDSKAWVDMWVSLDEEGFVEVAKRFGIDIGKPTIEIEGYLWHAKDLSPVTVSGEEGKAESGGQVFRG